MRLARQLGIAPRRLWGWEPKTVTKHKYKNGKLVETTSRTESEWDAESYELLAALDAIDADRHGPCGHLLSESTSMDANPDNRDGSIRYVVDPPSRCFACEALKQAQSAPAYSGENADAGRMWSVRREDR